MSPGVTERLTPDLSNPLTLAEKIFRVNRPWMGYELVCACSGSRSRVGRSVKRHEHFSSKS
jgi:hypothetical protein